MAVESTRVFVSNWYKNLECIEWLVYELVNVEHTSSTFNIFLSEPLYNIFLNNQLITYLFSFFAVVFFFLCLVMFIRIIANTYIHTTKLWL